MLKTDYKDDLFEGERKYKMTTDTEGKVTLKDETTYTQKGTSFGALDMNNTNTAVNRLYGEKSVTLTGAGWTSTPPYAQTIKVEGMLDTDRPFIECAADITSKAEKTRIRKEWDKVDRIVTGEGQFTAYCTFEKPSMDLPLKIKGA